jgi:adenylyl-sulfate kinase
MNGQSIWVNGLSGAGKSTLAKNLYVHLKKNNDKVIVLDGDTMRAGLNRDLGFSMADRKENIRRVAEINKLFLLEGYKVINSFIAPTEEIRQVARNIIGAENIIEISLTTPLEVCKKRDPKGLYKLAEQGIIKEMTGIDSIYEYCVHYTLELDTSLLNPNECLNKILTVLLYRSTCVS